MLNLLVAGALVLLVSLVGYRAWVRPDDPEPPTGYALGTIRGAQFGMVLGASAMLIGFVALLAEAIRRLF
jgi:hypothetical protein